MAKINVKDVFDVIRSSTSYSILYHSWSDLARQLQIEEVLIHELRRDLLVKTITFNDLLHIVLDESCGRNSDGQELGVLLKAFQACGNTELYENLRAAFGESTVVVGSGRSPYTSSDATKSSTKKGIKYNIKAPVNLFTGRESEILELHETVQNKKNTFTVVSQTTSVSGLGGIGKTQLVRQYIVKHKQDFENIVWCNADDQSSLEDQFRNLCKDKLGIRTKDADGTNKNINTIISEVYQYFEGTTSLFVFDNAEDSKWLNSFLPTEPDSGTICVVMTSQTREWGSDVQVLNLSELKLEEAVEMVMKGLSTENESTEQIQKLCTTLQCFPLALSQAISFISERQVTSDYTIQNYLEEYNKHANEMLSYEILRKETKNDYFFTTATTVRLTKSRVQINSNIGKLAIKILESLAYFAPENIHRDTIVELFVQKPPDNKVDKPSLVWNFATSMKNYFLGRASEEKLDKITAEDVINAVRLLVKYSMINAEDSKQTVLSIHRLVQQIVLIDIRSEHKEEKILDLLLAQFTENLNDQSILHAVQAWKHSWNYTAIVVKYMGKLFDLTFFLNKTGRNRLILTFCEEAIKEIKIHQEKLAGSCEDIDEVLFELQCSYGEALRRLHMLDEAKQVFEDMVKDARKRYGEEHSLTLKGLERLSSVLHVQGKYKECIAIDRNLLAIYESQSDFTHSIHAKLSIAVNLMQEGELDEADFLFQDILSDKNFNIAEDTQDTFQYIYTKCHYSTLVYKRGEYSIAKKILLEALDMTKVLKEFNNIRLTLQLNRGLGFYISNQGTDSEEGLKFLETTLQKHTDVLGKDHRHTLTVLGYIGTVHRQLGDFERATKLHEEVYDALLQANKGNDKPIFIQSARMEVGLNLVCSGKVLEGIHVVEQVLDRIRSMFDKMDIRITEYKIKYCKVLVQQKLYKEAKEILERIREDLGEEKSERVDIVLGLEKTVTENDMQNFPTHE